MILLAKKLNPANNSTFIQFVVGNLWSMWKTKSILMRMTNSTITIQISTSKDQIPNLFKWIVSSLEFSRDYMQPKFTPIAKLEMKVWHTVQICYYCTDSHCFLGLQNTISTFCKYFKIIEFIGVWTSVLETWARLFIHDVYLTNSNGLFQIELN